MRWIASWFTTGPPNHPLFAGGAAFCLLAAGTGDIGREKLTDREASSSSDSWVRWLVAGLCPLAAPALPPLSKLTPLPLPLGAGDPPRYVGSRLDARRWATLWCAIFFGTGGTGGALVSAGLPLPGDGARNERSVMEAELDWRCKGTVGCLEKLALDECDPRRTMRLVTVSPTGVGVVT